VDAPAAWFVPMGLRGKGPDGDRSAAHSLGLEMHLSFDKLPFSGSTHD
jgi:hypothetical protein